MLDGLHEDVDGQLVTIMQVANDLNLPFCLLKLKSTLRRPDATRLDSGQESVVPTLMDAIRSSIDRGSTVWAQVIAVLEKSHTAQVGCCQALVGLWYNTDIKQLREMAEAELLCNLTSSTSAMSSSLKQTTTALEGLLAIIDVTNDDGVPDAAASYLLTRVVETLDYVLSALSGVASEAQALVLEESAPVAKQQRLDIIYLKSVTRSLDPRNDIDGPSIDVILRLLVIHHRMFSHLKSSQSNIARLLLTLGSLLVHCGLTHNATLSTRTFDVLALLTDSLADDTRATCIRILADQYKTRDPRLRFLFGYSDGVDGEGLQLTSSSTLSSSPTTATTTTASESKRGGPKITMQQPFPLRRWEMMQEATPIVGENDTSLSLGLFGARKAVLQL